MRVKLSLFGLFLWFLLLLSAAGLLPGQVFVLDVLDGVVKADELLLLPLLLQQLIPLSPLPVQLLLLLLLVPLLEDLQLPVGILDLLVELADLQLQFFLGFFGLGGELLALLLDLRVLPEQVLLELLVHQRLSADEGLDVLYFRQQGLFGLVEYPGLVGDFCLGLFGEVGDLNFGLLLYLHEVFLDLLDLGLILRYFLIELLLL